MHELSLAQSILDIVEQEMTRHGASRVNVIRLDVGEFTAVVPESLSFCFEVIAKGTPLEGVKLELNPVPLTGRCKGCGEEFKIQAFNFTCPRCEAKDIETIAGKELQIKEIEAE
jgi:hydrogenase nickel incorporation protein HypA/HybF